jgi:ribosome modulation factor
MGLGLGLGLGILRWLLSALLVWRYSFGYMAGISRGNSEEHCPIGLTRMDSINELNQWKKSGDCM